MSALSKIKRRGASLPGSIFIWVSMTNDVKSVRVSNASNAKFVWIGIEDPTTDRRKQTIDLYNIDVSGVNSCY